MNSERLQILLADDDKDDCFLFAEALRELPFFTNLNTVHDGEQLMNYLYKGLQQLPDIIFLDLSMPRKNGFECLSEIKHSDKLKDIFVIMFSTSFPSNMHYEQDMINLLYKIGAEDYIRKPADFRELKQIIYDTLNLLLEKNSPGRLNKI
jgi:CheY-like chemotaxis protein